MLPVGDCDGPSIFKNSQDFLKCKRNVHLHYTSLYYGVVLEILSGVNPSSPMSVSYFRWFMHSINANVITAPVYLVTGYLSCLVCDIKYIYRYLHETAIKYIVRNHVLDLGCHYDRLFYQYIRYTYKVHLARVQHLLDVYRSSRTNDSGLVVAPIVNFFRSCSQFSSFIVNLSMSIDIRHVIIMVMITINLKIKNV